MRSMASGAAFHCAYLHATQQAFLEAHELAFAYFGGVFRKLRYDNLTSAVKKVLRGSRRRRDRSVRGLHVRIGASKRSFVRQPSPTRRAASKEKPDIFGATTGCRCPKQRISPIGNRQLLEDCQQDEHRLIAGREQTVGAAHGDRTRAPFAALWPSEGADLAQTSFPTVNGLGCVKVLTNTYFGAVAPAGAQVQAKAYASSIELWHGGRCVARHERCYRHHQQILDLEHYLDVLYQKAWCPSGIRSRWSRGVRPVYGRRASTGSGKH